MKVTITPEAERRLWAFIERINTEVGGFGYAKITEDGVVWDETFLVPQTVSTSEVEFDGGGIAAAVERAAQDGVLGTADHVWVSWHSHHTMDAFWSATDEACIKTYAEAGIPMLLSFVGTHSGKYRMRMDFFDVEHRGVTIPTVTMDKIEFHTAKREADDIDEEIKANVKKREFKQLTTAAKPYTTKGKPPTKPKPPKAEEELMEHDGIGVTVEEAFEIRDLMQEHDVGFDAAFELWLTGETATPFDQLAWS